MQPRNELKEIDSLYKELDELYHIMTLKVGISDSAFQILYTIASLGDGCSQKDIARLYYTSRQTINSSTKKLEKEGYIQLLKVEGERDKKLFLTEAGKLLVEEKIYPIIQLENQVYEDMEPEELKDYLRLTRKCISLFRKRVHEMTAQTDNP